MRDNKSFGSFGLPFFACMGVLAFFLSVGLQLYLQGPPRPEGKIAKVDRGTAGQEDGTRDTPVDSESTIEEVDSEGEPPAPSRPEYTAAGQLISPTGKPVEGADVRLFLIQGDQERELTRLLSDSKGRFESKLKSLAQLSTEALMAASIEARIVAAGHLPLRRQITPTKDEDWLSPEITLSLGHYLRGRILNSAGDPVVQCTVDLYLNCPPGTPRSDTKRTQRTDQHGGFVFGWKRGQSLRFVDAEHPNWGSATIALNSHSTDGDQEIEDIRLDQGGVLAGSVECKFGGDLLPGVRIDAHPSKSNKKGKRKWTETGTDGRFHLSGLVPGEYTIWVEDAPDPVGTWNTGSQKIELEVDLVRLVVSVRDPRHNPLPGQRIQFVNIAGNTAASMVEPASDTSRGSDAVVVFSPARLLSSSDDETTSRIAVAMRATGVTLPTYEELIDIPEDACRIDHTFTLISAEELGRLQVHVMDEDEEYLLDPVITLTSLLSGEQVTNVFDHDEDPQTWLGTVPPGEYDLQVAPRNPWRAQNMMLEMGTNEPVTVRMGRETRVELKASLGGRVRLLVETKEASTLTRASYPTRTAHATIQRSTSSTPIDEAPSFEVELEEQAQTELPVRKTVLSFGVLEPGEYQLRITCPEYAPQLLTFKVEPGVISDQYVALERL